MDKWQRFFISRTNRWLIISAIALFVIWFIGPFITISTLTPFRSINARLIVTAILFAAWLGYSLYHIFLRQFSKRALQKRGLSDSDIEKVNKLTDQFTTTLTQLKRKHRPWFMVLGGPNAGKSCLLSNAHITSLSDQQTSLHYWQKDDCLFIEANSHLGLQPSNHKLIQCLWQRLTSLIKRYRHFYFISHIIICIDANSLVHNTWQQSWHYLMERLADLKKQNTRLPISLVVTQSDHLAGFSEFFSDLGPEEREQPLGIEFDHNEHGDLNQHFANKYIDLLTRLSDRLLWRMHHENSKSKRLQLKDFPIHMEQLADALTQLVQQLPCDQRMPLDSLYFTSSSQNSTPTNIMTEKALVTTNTDSEQHAYFIKDVFQQLIKKASSPWYQPRQYFSQRILGMIAAVIIVLSITGLWHWGYQQSTRQLTSVEDILVRAENNPLPSNTFPWLSQLNYLLDAMTALDTHPVIYYQWIGLNQAARLNTAIHKRYTTLLHQSFAPFIEQTLRLSIRSHLSSNQLALYNALKTYKMLANHRHYKEAFVMHWFHQTFAKQYANSPSEQAQLLMHLKYALNHNAIQWTVNPSLVKQAQRTLQALPLADLAFLELQGQYPTTPVALLPEAQSMPGINMQKTTIPVFYSASSFKTIYDDVIPSIPDDINAKNWIVGKKKVVKLSKADKKVLIKQIREIYMNYYANEWLSAIPSIALNKPTTFKQVQQAIRLLSDPNSALFQVLKIIIGNANLNHILNKNTANANISYLAIIQYMNHQGSYNTIQNQLLALTSYLDKNRLAHDPNKASYLTAISRLQNQGKSDPITALINLAAQMPRPIQQWLRAIAQGGWHVLLVHSNNYLNQLWQDMVIPDYEKTIADQYPVFANSSSDISLQQFTNFFGPQGTMDTFFTYYVQPFVNTDGNIWQWQKLNGEGLPATAGTLKTFMRASLIQKMFFGLNRDKLATQFSLTPIDLSKNVTSVTLQIGKQSMTTTRNSSQAIMFQWPSQHSDNVSIQFSNNNGSTASLSQSGVWAWFRLLSSANIEPSRNPKQYFVTFKQGNDSVSYELISTRLVNPYLQNVLSQFRCSRQF